MNLDNLTIGEIKQLQNIFSVDVASKEDYGKQIVILQRGWVVVGDLVKHGTQFTLNNASVVRNWGTTRGLGEIASNGPTEKTKLDPCPEMKFHELTVIGMMKCDESKWT